MHSTGLFAQIMTEGFFHITVSHVICLLLHLIPEGSMACHSNEKRCNNTILFSSESSYPVLQTLFSCYSAQNFGCEVFVTNWLILSLPPCYSEPAQTSVERRNQYCCLSLYVNTQSGSAKAIEQILGHGCAKSWSGSFYSHSSWSTTVNWGKKMLLPSQLQSCWKTFILWLWSFCGNYHSPPLSLLLLLICCW